jgi:hypothetical protein
MPTQEYVIRYADSRRQMRQGGRLIGGRSNRMEALHVAEALARGGADRGERSTTTIRDVDGSVIELPAIRPA